MKRNESISFWGNLLGSGVQTGLGVHQARKQAEQDRKLQEAWLTRQAKVLALQEEYNRLIENMSGMNAPNLNPGGGLAGQPGMPIGQPLSAPPQALMGQQLPPPDVSYPGVANRRLPERPLQRQEVPYDQWNWRQQR